MPEQPKKIDVLAKAFYKLYIEHHGISIDRAAMLSSDEKQLLKDFAAHGKEQLTAMKTLRRIQNESS